MPPDVGVGTVWWDLRTRPGHDTAIRPYEADWPPGSR